MPAWITSLLREEMPVPIAPAASATTTSAPAPAAARATASPTTPAPTTKTCIEPASHSIRNSRRLLEHFSGAGKSAFPSESA